MNKKNATELCVELGLDPLDLVDIGSGLWTFKNVPTVKPETASKWLETYNKNNRKPKSRNIDKIYKDIIGGHWHGETSPDGVSFLDNSDIGNGQNRLMALVQSKMPIKIRVYLGMSKQAMSCVDNGVTRTIMDFFGFMGVDHITKQMVSASKFYLGGHKKGDTISLSAEILIEKCDSIKDELEFVFGSIPSSTKCVTAGVRAAIMRAYHYYKNNPEKMNKIQLFCNYLSQGTNPMPNPAVVSFKESLIEQDYGGQGRKGVYIYTEEVLAYYLSGSEKRFRRNNAPRELFPFGDDCGGEKLD